MVRKIVVVVTVLVALMLAFAAPVFAGEPNENAGFGQRRSEFNDEWGRPPGQAMKTKAQDGRGPGASWWVGRKTENNTDRDHPQWPTD